MRVQTRPACWRCCSSIGSHSSAHRGCCQSSGSRRNPARFIWAARWGRTATTNLFLWLSTSTSAPRWQRLCGPEDETQAAAAREIVGQLRFRGLMSLYEVVGQLAQENKGERRKQHLDLLA